MNARRHAWRLPDNRLRQRPRRMQRGPLAPHLDAFEWHLHSLGYASANRLSKVGLIARLSVWMMWRGRKIEDLDEELANRFLRNRWPDRRPRPGGAATLRVLLRYLRDVKAISRKSTVIELETPSARLETMYRSYLEQERGLADGTVKNHLFHTRLFLKDRFGPDALDLTALCAEDVISFVRRFAHDRGIGCAKRMVHALRSFLAYIFLCGDTPLSLAGCLPSVRRGEQAVPPSLKPDEVESLLEHFNLDSATGLRDFAILSLMIRFGLRNVEVALLTLEDMNWEAGEFTIRGKGAHTHRLPIYRDIGMAIVEYLKHGRPECSTRRIFICAKAPHIALRPSGVGQVVKRAAIRAGVKPAGRCGGHLLRHTVARSMLKQGASLQEIGQILHHQHPDTTEIYAKVDIEALRQIASMWPWERGL